MKCKRYKVIYKSKTWEGIEKIFTLFVHTTSQEKAQEMAEELTFPALIISIEEQD